MQLYELNPDMYSQIIDPNLKLGYFSKTWILFKSGKYHGKNVLIKVPLSNRTRKDAFKFKKSKTLNIQLDELNCLVAEIISLAGDPNGECAEYFLAKEDDDVYICTPSFIKNGEELISGKDLPPEEHKKFSRVNPDEALVIAKDLEINLKRRRLAKNIIEKCKIQALKDCFKLAYLGMFDPNNSNWGILYDGAERSARYAPLYDLDLCLNIPFSYEENITPERREKTSKYMEELLSGEYIRRYIEIFSSTNSWFDEFVLSFYQGVSNLDFKRELLDRKGISIEEEALSHYQEFLMIQNNAIREYLIRRGLLHTKVIIAFSGIDGSGKSTQIDRTEKALASLGYVAKETRPKLHNKPDIMSNDRENKKSGMISICTQLRDYYQIHNIEQGVDVLLCDRYTLDYRALAKLMEVDDEEVELILGELPEADLTILFDTDIEVSLARIQKRANEKAVQPHENRRTLTKLKNFMMTDIMEAQKKQSSILVVNSSASIEDIQSQIMQKIIERLISRKNKSNNNHSTNEEKEI